MAAFGLILGSAALANAQEFLPNRYTDPETNQVLEYNMVLPPAYDQNADRKYPLLVCLHAANNTNPPNRTLSSDGKCYVSAFTRPEHPSFFMVPISQTNSSGWGDAGPTRPISEPQKFEGRLTVVVIKELLTRYKIDPDRLYVTGPSMGARGTWDMIRRNPTLFAAAAPAAGPADPADAMLYANQNIWAINGTNDSTAGDNTAAIDAIRMAGGNPIYTLLQGRGHDTWRSVYRDPQFITWMYAQRRGVPWWQHPPAAPTTLQADPANGSVALVGGVSTVPPPGLGPTSPFPNGTGAIGTGGSAGAAGSAAGGSMGDSGGGGAPAGGAAGQPNGSAGATTVAGAAGSAAVAGSGGMGALPVGGAPATSGAPGAAGLSTAGGPETDLGEEGGCSVAGSGRDVWKSTASLLLLALSTQLRRRRRKVHAALRT